MNRARLFISMVLLLSLSLSVGSGAIFLSGQRPASLAAKLTAEQTLVIVVLVLDVVGFILLVCANIALRETWMARRDLDAHEYGVTESEWHTARSRTAGRGALG